MVVLVDVLVALEAPALDDVVDVDVSIDFREVDDRFASVENMPRTLAFLPIGRGASGSGASRAH